MGKRLSKIIWLAAAGIVVVAAIIWLWPDKQNPNQSSSNKTSTTKQSKSKIISSKLIVGEPTAPQTIIQYGDFQCPICKRFFEQTEPSLRREYIDTKKANLEFRVETHIGDESVTSGQAAWCANDQQAFDNYRAELYKRQAGTDSGAFSKANLKLIASGLKLDLAKFSNCLDQDKYLDRATASNDEARQRGVTATPTFY